MNFFWASLTSRCMSAMSPCPEADVASAVESRNTSARIRMMFSSRMKWLEKSSHGTALRHVHRPQLADREKEEPGENHHRHDDRGSEPDVIEIREPALIQPVHHRNRVVADAQHPHPGHEPGEEAFPQKDGQQSDTECVRRNQNEPHKRRRRQHSPDQRGYGYGRLRLLVAQERYVADRDRAERKERPGDGNRRKQL